MKKIKYVSLHARDEFVEYIRMKGYEVKRTEPVREISGETSFHPDLRMTRLGVSDDAPLFFMEDDESCRVRDGYPNDIPFNAACTGRFFIHNLKYTSPGLLKAAEGMELINVRQGYTKCSTLIVDESSVITYDEGIFSACDGKLSVLLIRPGYVRLPGYSTGFIGGTAGRVGDEIVFNGDISLHPDFESIRSFIETRGLSLKWFSWELTDTGSVI